MLGLEDFLQITYFYIKFSGIAYNQFLRDLKISCENDLGYCLQKSNRSLAPRRPDFNRLYQAYCQEKYGSRNGAEMYSHLNQVVSSYLQEEHDALVTFQAYEQTEEETITFILAMVTPQMKRVHNMVRI